MLNFEPDRIVMQKVDGTQVASRDDPEKSFEGQRREVPWMTFMWLISVVRHYGPISPPRSFTSNLRGISDGGDSLNSGGNRYGRDYTQPILPILSILMIL